MMNFKFLLMASILFSVFSFAEREREREREVLISKIIERQEELRKIKKRREAKQKARQIAELQSRQFESEQKEIRIILNKIGQMEPEEIPLIERSKPSAHGIILEFNEWPPVEQRAILAKLKSNGLEEDTKLKRFKIWIYKYSQPRKVEDTEKLCELFISFKSVPSCEPDTSIHSQQSREEFYKEQVKRAEEEYEKAKKDYEKANEDYKKAQEEHKKISDYVDQDLEIKKNAELDVENDKQGVQRARQILERAKKRNNKEEIIEAEKRLKDREEILSNSREWLKKAVKYYEESLREFKDSEDWVQECAKWLDNRKRWLKQKEDWLKEIVSKKPTQEPPKTPEQPEQPPEKKEEDKEKAHSEIVNVRTCKVVSSKLNLSQIRSSIRNSLSDYWAQEMIGADLLKEMLKKKAPVEKIPFIQLFDSKTQNKHAEHVKNLISSNGRHSVLPNLGDGIRIFETNKVGDYLKHSDKILSEMEEACIGSSNKSTNKENDGQR